MQRLVTGLSALSQPTAGPIRARCDSAAAALAHEPRGVRTPRESAPCPRELALRARERDTSPLPRLPTPSVCSAVRASLCERDEHKGGSIGSGLADSAHRNHAHNAMRSESPANRISFVFVFLAQAHSHGRANGGGWEVAEASSVSLSRSQGEFSRAWRALSRGSRTSGLVS